MDFAGSFSFPFLWRARGGGWKVILVLPQKAVGHTFEKIYNIPWFAAPGMEPCSFELTADGEPMADEQKIRFLDIKVQNADD